MGEDSRRERGRPGSREPYVHPLVYPTSTVKPAQLGSWLVPPES